MSNQSKNTDSPISLPKVGGSISGIGETFQANIFTGTGNFSIPIPISPCRGNKEPNLHINYSTGNGNDIFGLGWKIDLPKIQRKTEKGIPKYHEEDIFILTNAEDLVPYYDENTNQIKTKRHDGFTITYYRLRTEGLFARIEKWREDNGCVHWRVISTDNVTSIFGKNTNAKLFDLDNPKNVFEWYLEESFDAKGNHVYYEYISEDPNLKLYKIYERNRKYNRKYIRRILYGNVPTKIPNEKIKDMPFVIGTHHKELLTTKKRFYLFEVIFDYGDINDVPMIPFKRDEFIDKPNIKNWPIRDDSASCFRSGFEIRTMRRCERILILHHIKENELIDAPLVKAMEFEYVKELKITLLDSIKIINYKKTSGNKYQSVSLPAISFKYTKFEPDKQNFKSITAVDGDMPSFALNDSNIALIDLFGNGLPDILQTTNEVYYFWRNLGNGLIDRRHPMHTRPNGVLLSDDNIQLGDIGGNGLSEIIVQDTHFTGFYEIASNCNWKKFVKFEKFPNIDLANPNLKLIDLTGDGLSDILISRDDYFVWYKCLGEKGYDDPEFVYRKHSMELFPDIYFNDTEDRIRLADMNGDGLSDIVYIHDNQIEYWPNMGYGEFGGKIIMQNSPKFGFNFNPRFLYLADLNGLGCSDLVYVENDKIKFWFNESGNGWSEGAQIIGTPPITDYTSIHFSDFLGSGTASIIWSYDFTNAGNSNYKMLDFCGGKKPFLLNEMINGMGISTKVEYSPSTKYYLEDEKNGNPWITKLPFPVQVLDKVETLDFLNKSKKVTCYNYRHGYYCGKNREFRGFGCVEQYDTEDFEHFADNSLHNTELILNNKKEFYVPVVLTKTWFHLGLYYEEQIELTNNEYLDQKGLFELYKMEFYNKDNNALKFENHVIETGNAPHEAYRALRGSIIRKEVYGKDNSINESHPYMITENLYFIKLLQRKMNNCYAVFLPIQKESLVYHYERNPNDPRINHKIILEFDNFGNPLESVNICYPRRPSSNNFKEQNEIKILYTMTQYINKNNIDEFYFIGIPYEERVFEIHGLKWNWLMNQNENISPLNESNFPNINNPNEFLSNNIKYIDDGKIKKRILKWTRYYYRKSANVNIIDKLDSLKHRLKLGEIEDIGLPYESYDAVFNKNIINEIYQNYSTEIKPFESGFYYPHPGLGNSEIDAVDYWWIPSGRSSFNEDKFYIIEETQDPFGEKTKINFDDYALFPISVENAVSLKYNLNQKIIVENNYRVLKPFKITNQNNNTKEIKFNILGLVVGSIQYGFDENGTFVGDSFDNFIEDLSENEIIGVLNDPLPKANELIKNATTRVIYDLNRFSREKKPNTCYIIARETHSSYLNGSSPILQHKFIYSDGFNRKVQTKTLVDPGNIGRNHFEKRWKGTGSKILNNKGKEVQKFENFFCENHEFGIEKHGVSEIVFYDPLERIICTFFPDSSYTKVIFDPWMQEYWDRNDTICSNFKYDPKKPNLLPDTSLNFKDDIHVGQYFSLLDESICEATWYNLRTDPNKSQAIWPNSSVRKFEERSAKESVKHSSTPMQKHLDCLGYIFQICQDLGKDENGNDKIIKTKIKLDILGNEIKITDPRNIKSSFSKFDMTGRMLYQESSDSGKLIVFPDINNNLIFSWDSFSVSRAFKKQIDYDELNRPIKLWVSKGSNKWLKVETIYGERESNASKYNLIGQISRQYDGAGLIKYELFNFKENLIKKSRFLIKEDVINSAFGSGGKPDLEIDWKNVGDEILDNKGFTTTQKSDALNRIFYVKYPDESIVEINYAYSDLIKSMIANNISIIDKIDYNEKGQKTKVVYGKKIVTEYSYYEDSYRLRRMLTYSINGRKKFLQDYCYFYDPIGNILTICDLTKSNKSSNQTLNCLVENTQEFVYDPIYRLVSSKGIECINVQSALRLNVDIPICNDPTKTREYIRKYTYDSSNNITDISHKAPPNGRVLSEWNLNYAFGVTNNKLAKVENAQGTKDIKYDSNGNLKGICGKKHFYWDYANRLVAATHSTPNNVNNTSMQAIYLYDEKADRVMKIVKKGCVINSSLYIDGIFEIFIKKRNSTIEEHKSYKHIKEGNNRIVTIKEIFVNTEPDNEPLVLYHNNDHLGNSNITTKEDGNFFSQEIYYPFGETCYGSYSKKRFRYCGKERDEVTGFYYYGKRYYSPFLRRWINCDPAGLVDGTNLFIYARNNPILYIDKKGNNAEEFANDIINNKIPAMREKTAKKAQIRSEKLAKNNFESREQAIAAIKEGEQELAHWESKNIFWSITPGLNLYTSYKKSQAKTKISKGKYDLMNEVDRSLSRSYAASMEVVGEVVANVGASSVASFVPKGGILKGSKNIAKSSPKTRIANRIEHAIKQSVHALDSMKARIRNIPDEPGVYVIRSGNEIYIGKSFQKGGTKGIRSRLSDAFHGGHEKARELFEKPDVSIDYYITKGGDAETRWLETHLLEEYSGRGLIFMNDITKNAGDSASLETILILEDVWESIDNIIVGSGKGF